MIALSRLWPLPPDWRCWCFARHRLIGGGSHGSPDTAALKVRVASGFTDCEGRHVPVFTAVFVAYASSLANDHCLLVHGARQLFVLQWRESVLLNDLSRLSPTRNFEQSLFAVFVQRSGGRQLGRLRDGTHRVDFTAPGQHESRIALGTRVRGFTQPMCTPLALAVPRMLILINRRVM